MSVSVFYHVNLVLLVYLVFQGIMILLLFVLFVKPGENLIFLKKGKMVILVNIRNFSRSWMMKRISQLELSHEI